MWGESLNPASDPERHGAASSLRLKDILATDTFWPGPTDRNCGSGNDWGGDLIFISYSAFFSGNT